MKKRLISIAIASLMVLAMVPLGILATDNSSGEPAYLGFGGVTNFREGPGSDETGTPVYTLNYTYAVVLFDADGKIVDIETDIIELSTPNYDGDSMPHFTGWPTTAGYNTFNHAADKIDAPVVVTEAAAIAEVETWKSKRERGDSYHMKTPTNTGEWYEQMNFFESWFRGKTVAEIRNWFDKSTTSAGRPIKPTTTNEADKAKLAKLTADEKAALADVLAGATMALEDPHGLTLTAMEKAFANKVAVKNGGDITSLGLGTDKIFRISRGSYSINYTTVGAAFNAKGEVAASVFDIVEIVPDGGHGTAPVLAGWPGTNGMDGTAITVDSIKSAIDQWQTKRERGDTYAMKSATNAGEWYEQMNFYQDWFVGKTIPAINTWFVKHSTAAGRPIKASTTDANDLAKLASLTDAERAALADVLAGATMSLEDGHGRMLSALKDANNNKKSITGTAAEHSALGKTTTDAIAGATPRESSVPADVHYNMSANGYWIHSVLSDVKLDEVLRVDGTYFGSSGDPNGKAYRKLALYTQDDKRVVTAEFTLTTPGVIVTSPNFRIQQGTVKGNVYVNATGFELYNSTIDGNLIFRTQEQRDSALLDRGKVTGTITVGDIDTIAGATPKESSDAANIVYSMSDKGYWIMSLLSDVTVVDALHVDGVYYGSSGNVNGKAYRKLALYAQDDKRNVTAEYTLTVPEVFVTSPGFRIQQGTLKGNVHVNAFGFELYNSTIDGNLTFETQEQRDSALLDRGKVTGTISVGYVDTVGGATPRESSDPYRINKSLSAEGYWILSLLSDVQLVKTLNIDGTFYGKSGNVSGSPDRKLALYAQDSARKVTAEFTLTVPEVVITSPNLRVVNGTIKGDVHVKARGFKLEGTASIDGNLIFESQELRDSATFDESKVKGTITIKG